MNNTNIQIVKLKNGENLIANVSIIDGSYILEEPMEFDVFETGQNAGNLMMKHWLPVSLVKKNQASIRDNDILSVLEPDEEFCEYYLNTIEKIKRLVEAKNEVENMDEEQINQLMEHLSNKKTVTVH
jgi:hypothetical protein